MILDSSMVEHSAVNRVVVGIISLLILLSTYSSIAQLVEHAAVNRAVVGSSPTRGAFFRNSMAPWSSG